MKHLQIMPRRAEGTQYAVRLTPREVEVGALAASLKNREIGQMLGISPKTVKQHLLNISRRTGLDGRAAIAVYVDRAERKAA